MKKGVINIQHSFIKVCQYWEMGYIGRFLGQILRQWLLAKFERMNLFSLPESFLTLQPWAFKNMSKTNLKSFVCFKSKICFSTEENKCVKTHLEKVIAKLKQYILKQKQAFLKAKLSKIGRVTLLSLPFSSSPLESHPSPPSKHPWKNRGDREWARNKTERPTQLLTEAAGVRARAHALLRAQASNKAVACTAASKLLPSCYCRQIWPTFVVQAVSRWHWPLALQNV